MKTGNLNTTIKSLLTEEDSATIQKKTSKLLTGGDAANLDEEGFETIASAPGADDAANLSKGVKQATFPNNDPKAKTSSKKTSVDEEDDSVEIEFSEDEADTFPNIFDEEDDDKKDVSEEDDDLDEEDDDKKEVSEEDDDKKDVSEEDDDKKDVSEEDDDDLDEEDDDKKDVSEEDDDDLDEEDDDKKDVSEEDDDDIDEDDDFDVDLDEEDEDEKKAVSEEVRKLFASTLNEENQNKVIGLFESYTSQRIKKNCTKLNEALKAAYIKRTKKFEGQIVKNLDRYLDYVVEEWVKTNKLAAKRSLRAEIAEEFISKLAKLMREHSFDVPEGKRDLLQTVVSKAKKLEADLSEQVTLNVQMKQKLKDAKRAIIFTQETAKLSDVQRERAAKLVESVTYTTADEYAQKVRSIISENVVRAVSTKSPKRELIKEEVLTEDEISDSVVTSNLSPEMKVFTDSLSRVRPRK